jgi:hypothetical protein
LKTKRYVIEQFNGHVKGNVLDECWVWSRGPAKKTSMVISGLISMDANAIEAIVEGEESLKSVSKYWA